jgi:anti-sigma-K factor RskA
MSEAEDIEMLAAEYALGTLPAAERAGVALRARSEVSLAAAIEAWERRLAPLAETIPPRQAPSTVWPAIEARLDELSGGIAATANVIGIERRLRRWRTAAITASVIAASLVIFVGAREFTPRSADKMLVAVLQKDAQSPAFLVSVDLERRQLTIRAVAAKPQPGKSYELWLVHDELKSPRSLGVIGESPLTVGPTLASYAPNVIEDATLAVSLEPEGGSKTGVPTGPILFTGKLIEAAQ